jgi:hypothetical protein
VNYLVQEESELDLSEVVPKHTEKTRKFRNYFLVNYLVQEESELDLREVQPKHTEKTSFFSELPCTEGI